MAKKNILIGNLFHPISMVIHYHGARIIKKLNPSNVLDIGGTEKLKDLLDCSVCDVNKRNGVDGTNLPYEDNTWDVSCSFSTLEHVGGIPDQVKFLNESSRVSKKGFVHWFPCGQAAKKVELFKKGFKGYKHPCYVPLLEELSDISFKYHNFITIREHLLLLCTLYPQMNCISTYDFIEIYGDETYGIVIEKI